MELGAELPGHAPAAPRTRLEQRLPARAGRACPVWVAQSRKLFLSASSPLNQSTQLCQRDTSGLLTLPTPLPLTHSSPGSPDLPEALPGVSCHELCPVPAVLLGQNPASPPTSCCHRGERSGDAVTAPQGHSTPNEAPRWHQPCYACEGPELPRRHGTVQGCVAQPFPSPGSLGTIQGNWLSACLSHGLPCSSAVE